MRLSEAKEFDTVTVTEVDIENEKNRLRLSEMGLSKGSEITPLYAGVSGRIRAYEIKGCVLALRYDVADRVTVE